MSDILFRGKIVSTSMYKNNGKTQDYRVVLRHLRVVLNPLLAFSNPIILLLHMSSSIAKFVGCSHEDGQSPIFVTSVEYSFG